MEQKQVIPTTFVILGATGDLMAKKIVPALFGLHEVKALPKEFRIVGISRRDWHDEDLRKHVAAILAVKAPHASQELVESFLERVIYHKITFETPEDYVALGEALQRIDEEHQTCSNKLFYLSVPPQFYKTILENIHKAKLAELCDPQGGWTRIVVEKPFGNDEKSARELDMQLAKLFKEDQIYRIDHYLAKETFQNIVTFRFYNNLFENDWGKHTVEKITIREFENIGVEDRGPFYESVGALRDVGQNHLLQMLALTTMDQPVSLTADAIRSKRAEILHTLILLDRAGIKKSTFRAQYDGYRAVKGVAADSQTETYFRVRGYLSHPRWEGVPIILEAGKRLIDPKEKKEITEIEVMLKHPQPCLCPPDRHYRNSIVFHQDPFEGITIHFWAKKPGFTMEAEERVFEFNLRRSERKSQYTEEYEKLLLDCIAGDQTLFTSSEEVAAMWRFVDPIVAAWSNGVVPLRQYAPDSPAIAAEAQVMDDAILAAVTGV